MAFHLRQNGHDRVALGAHFSVITSRILIFHLPFAWLFFKALGRPSSFSAHDSFAGRNEINSVCAEDHHLPITGQPFTAPAVRPLMNCLDISKYRINTGTDASDSVLRIAFQSVWYWPNRSDTP